MRVLGKSHDLSYFAKSSSLVAQPVKAMLLVSANNDTFNPIFIIIIPQWIFKVPYFNKASMFIIIQSIKVI